MRGFGQNLFMGRSAAWNNWLHCCGSTYGAWLRGDSRGWRARNHREHVDGDYKSPPPPGTYDKLLAQSQRLMKRQRVVLTPEQRAIACLIMGEALLFHTVELVDLCVGAKHWHALVRCHPPGSILTKDRMTRHLLGLAKKHSARFLSDARLADRGGVWALRCRVLPVHDRQHQLNVARYIPAHAKKGAVVWSLLRKYGMLTTALAAASRSKRVRSF